MTNKKIYKKIKRTNAWGSIITFLIFSVISIAVLAFAVDVFIGYAFDSKFENEYGAISEMARLYYEGTKNDQENILAMVEEDEHDFIVRDKNGKVIHKKGENTCSEKGENVYLSVFNDNVKIFTDTEISYISPKNGNVDFDYSGIYRWIRSGDAFKENEDYIKSLEEDSEKDNDEQDKEDEIETGINTSIEEVDDPEVNVTVSYSPEAERLVEEEFINLPIWMAVENEQSGETFIGKGIININVRDLVLIMYIVIALAFLMLSLLIVMLVNAISSVRRQNKITNYFFTDVVTQGKNWMWYQIKGDQLIHKRSSRRHNYAIINLVFVNYRNYCVCHSLQDGEKMLRRVNDFILRNISKREMCAHVSSSNFALVLKYDNTNELKARIQQLILNLETIDSNHIFHFQAGVSLVESFIDEIGRYSKRKDILIENEYNNACTARISISDSDESGVVFFDEKIIEEERWLDSVQEYQSKAVQNEEFIVYYQPKYDPKTNELRGAEALIRWQSPEFGFVTPNRFIPIFEKNGFITEIDHYMITHVAKDQKRWLDKGYKCVPVSVNVSRAHFIESDLAEQIRDMIDEAGCPHNLIEIELTESAFFDDKKAMIETINKLKSYGFSVSMDDFGSGYSSLNSLKDMPLDVLKLDAEFFRGDTEDGRGEIVVSEAIKLAKSLNMRTVAEGVEIKEQVDFLAKEGCDMIQGYYYAKPMPGNEYETKMVNA